MATIETAPLCLTLRPFRSWRFPTVHLRLKRPESNRFYCNPRVLPPVLASLYHIDESVFRSTIFVCYILLIVDNMGTLFVRFGDLSGWRGRTCCCQNKPHTNHSRTTYDAPEHCVDAL